MAQTGLHSCFHAGERTELLQKCPCTWESADSQARWNLSLKPRNAHKAQKSKPILLANQESLGERCCGLLISPTLIMSHQIKAGKICKVTLSSKWGLCHLATFKKKYLGLFISYSLPFTFLWGERDREKYKCLHSLCSQAWYKKETSEPTWQAGPG